METPTTAPRLTPIIREVQQRSKEWFDLRLGKVTGSEAKRTHYNISDAQKGLAIRMILDIKAISAKVKESPEFLELWEMEPIALLEKAGLDLPESEDRRKYREGKVAERITGQPADPDPFVTYDMKWGTINESIAVMAYMMQEKCLVEDGPFMEHPELKCGVSPDGLVTDTKTGEIGLLEVKCLRSANHLYKIIKTKEVPDDYMDQIQMQMWISGRDWCDFVGYDSRVPRGLEIFVKRVAYDPEYIANKLEPSIRRFLKECDSDERFFRKMIREDKEASAKKLELTK